MTAGRVPLPAGFDADATFARFARSGDDLLERWDGARLARCARHGDSVVPFVADVAAGELVVRARTARESEQAATAAAAMVEPYPPGWVALLDRDRALASVAARHPGLHAVRTLDPVVALVHSICAQQVNLRWAATTRRRVAEAYGDEVVVDGTALRVLDLHRLAAADPARLRELQLTQVKSRALVELARAVVTGALDLDALAARDDADVVAALTTLPGVGPWTAQWYLARVLGRPVVVAGDLAVRKAVGLLYGTSAAPGQDETLALTAHWGDVAVTAQQLVLTALSEGTLAS